MLGVDSLRHIFSQAPNAIKENAAEYVICFCEITHLIDLSLLCEEASLVHAFNSVRIDARFNYCSSEDLMFKPSEESQWGELGSRISQCIDEEGDYSVEIKVTKDVSDQGKYIIFCKDLFFDFLLTWSCREALAVLNQVFSSKEINSLECIFPNDGNTKLSFVGVDKEVRDLVIAKRKSISSIDGFEQLLLVPEDICIDRNLNIDQAVLDKIASLCSMLSLAYISNKACFSRNFLSYEIRGRSRIASKCEISDFNAKQNRIYELYQWIYTGGEVFDKSELARNILCYRNDSARSFLVSEEDVATIKSNYRVYLKESAKEYLDAREKLLMAVTEYSERVASCVAGYVGDFKKNLVAILGYIASLLLVQQINSPQTNFFTGEIAQISALILVVSCLFGIISWVIHWRRVAYYDKIIVLLRDSFQDVFGKELNTLVSNNPQKKYARKYFFVWSVALLVLWLLICGALLVLLNCLSGFTS